jgi:hypothetical protein
MRHSPTTRTRVTGLAATLALAAGALGGVALPAHAGPADDLHSIEHQHASGTVRSADGILRKGCHSHAYRYRVHAEKSDWSLELFLIDPDGEQVANGYEWKGHDPARGRGPFELCAQPTHAGTFTVRARLTWDDGEYHEKWLEPQKIQLRRG